MNTGDPLSGLRSELRRGVLVLAVLSGSAQSITVIHYAKNWLTAA